MTHKLWARLCLTFVLSLFCSGFLHQAQCLSFTASGEAFSQNLYDTLAEAYLYVQMVGGGHLSGGVVLMVLITV